MTKKISYKEKDKKELTSLLKEKREELRTLRFSGVAARKNDASAKRKTRKEIARILTERVSRRNVEK